MFRKLSENVRLSLLLMAFTLLMVGVAYASERHLEQVQHERAVEMTRHEWDVVSKDVRRQDYGSEPVRKYHRITVNLKSRDTFETTSMTYVLRITDKGNLVEPHEIAELETGQRLTFNLRPPQAEDGVKPLGDSRLVVRLLDKHGQETLGGTTTASVTSQ